MDAAFPIVFSAGMMGRSFKEISSELIHTTHHEVVRRWYHSDHDAELFIWTDKNKRIIKQQFFCFGQVVEWNIVHGVRTGAAVYDEKAEEAGETLRFDRDLLYPALHQACEVIKFIHILEESERDTLQNNFKSQAKREAGTLPPWMAALERPESRVSLWKRLVMRVKAWFNS